MGQSPGTAGLCTPEDVLYIVFWYLMRYQIPGLDPREVPSWFIMTAPRSRSSLGQMQTSRGL